MHSIIKSKKGQRLLYALLYASVVTFATVTLERLPVFLQMENAIYDGFQRMLTVDSRTDYNFKRYQASIDSLAFINLDNTYFNTETNRVRRDSLASLLRQLSAIPTVKGILLDYLLVPIKDDEQSKEQNELLIENMRPLQDKLVLPYELAFDTIPVWGELSAEAVSIPSPLLFETDNTGYVAAMPLPGDENYRYVKLSIEEKRWQSAVHALLAVLSNDNPHLYTRDVPNNFEINYLLRNYKQRTLPIIDASLVGNSKAQLRNKIIFIGLFDEVTTKYGLTIDKFQTAVQREMAGIYILVNTYLNVVNRAYIRRTAAIWVFLLNFLLAIASAWYFQRTAAIPLKSWGLVLGEIVGSSLFFLLFFFGLFYFFYHKFPLVITTLAFVSNQSFYKGFTYRIFSKYPIRKKLNIMKILLLISLLHFSLVATAQTTYLIESMRLDSLVLTVEQPDGKIDTQYIVQSTRVDKTRFLLEVNNTKRTFIQLYGYNNEESTEFTVIDMDENRRTEIIPIESGMPISIADCFENRTLPNGTLRFFENPIAYIQSFFRYNREHLDRRSSQVLRGKNDTEFVNAHGMYYGYKNYAYYTNLENVVIPFSVLNNHTVESIDLFNHNGDFLLGAGSSAPLEDVLEESDGPFKPLVSVLSSGANKNNDYQEFQLTGGAISATANRPFMLGEWYQMTVRVADKNGKILTPCLFNFQVVDTSEIKQLIGLNRK
ncbi:MAG: CHASE2 domain-containing protein [Bacteroidota bacterium]